MKRTKHAIKDISAVEDLLDFREETLFSADTSALSPSETDHVENRPSCGACPRATAACYNHKTTTRYRRAFSEVTLNDIMPDDVRPGETYHVISNGDIDSLSFLRYVLTRHPLKYLLFSTWCMAMDDVQQIKTWTEAGTIGRLDAYCGEIFKGSYAKEYAALAPVVRQTGGRLAIFRNHAKVYAGLAADGYAFAIESSANINTNPRAEQTTITADAGLYQHYKTYYDDIKSFTRDFDAWTPWVAT